MVCKSTVCVCVFENWANTMIENVTTELVMNCTLLVVERFPWMTNVNATQVAEYNRTELLDLLAEILTEEMRQQWQRQAYNFR